MKKLIALLLSLCLIAGIMPVMAESIRMHENTAEELLSQARALQDEGRYEEAVPLLQKAADMGDAEAQCALGICYSKELGVDRDYEKAFKYYMLAADQGNPEGQLRVGIAYRWGNGVEQDYGKALEYFRQAAEQGNSFSIYMIGECYYLGNGVEKDLDQAAVWFRKACDLGYFDVATEEERKRIEDVLGPQVDGDAPAVSAKDTTLTVEEICQAGAAAYDVGDYAKAAAYYELALKCYREAAGKGEEVVAEEPDRLVDEENAASNAAVDT